MTQFARAVCGRALLGEALTQVGGETVFAPPEGGPPGLRTTRAGKEKSRRAPPGKGVSMIYPSEKEIETLH